LDYHEHGTNNNRAHGLVSKRYKSVLWAMQAGALTPTAAHARPSMRSSTEAELAYRRLIDS